METMTAWKSEYEKPIGASDAVYSNPARSFAWFAARKDYGHGATRLPLMIRVKLQGLIV
jgi:hypothetical protein